MSTVSFDVFDTVVTRAFAHPRDLFVWLGVVLQRRGLPVPEALVFARARWAAELAARKKSPWTEVLIDDIYRELAAALGWDGRTTARALELELETESQHLRGIPLIRAELARARSAAERLVFLSDMYLPAPLLRPWLEREGAAAPGDLLLVSGEVRGNKSSGKLFEIARQRTGGDFVRWHHTGDHPFADVAKPRELGIAATHFTAAHLTARERAARGGAGEFATPWRSLLAGAMRLARLEHAPAGEREAVLWETGATVAGPLFYGFVRWTLAEAERRGLRRLYFLARDGQIFHRIAGLIGRDGQTMIECRYLYASRLVFAGQAELADPAALREFVAPGGYFHSLRQALRHLDLDVADLRAQLPVELGGLDPDANLPQPQREALADWLLDPARRPLLHDAVERRAAQARAYLATEGLVAGEPLGVVDTGWLGSIQCNIEHILGHGAGPVPLTGFYLGLMHGPGAIPSGPRLGYTNLHAPLPLIREESHKVLLELFAQSDHGQVIGYEPREGGWAPRLKDPGPVNLAEIRLFQESITAFANRMIEAEATTPAPEADLGPVVCALYRRLHDRPDRREARVLGSLPHADQAYEQHHAGLCADLDLRGLLAALRDFRQRPPHWWVQGQAALGHAPLLHAFRTLKRWRWRLGGRAE